MSRESDLGWAAGIIDGEGNIGISEWKAKGRKRRTFRLHVSVSNTSLAMLHHMREVFGVGAIYTRKIRCARHKPQWSWAAQAHEAELVLRAVEPYIVAKRKEVEIALISRRYILGRNTRAKYLGNPYSEKLAWLKRQLASLHHAPSIREPEPPARLPLFDKEN